MWDFTGPKGCFTGPYWPNSGAIAAKWLKRGPYAYIKDLIYTHTAGFFIIGA